jgi:HK97 family phage major capsid protein
MTAADIVFGTKPLSSYVISSKRVNASFQLLQDTGVDFETWLAGVLGSRIGRGLNPLLTNGTGAGLQPVGIVPNVAVGKQGIVGQTITVIYDDLIDLIHSVDASYRVGPEELLPEEPPPSGHLGWMLSDTTLKVCRKIRDAQQRPIVMDGTPTTMLGYRCSINNDMPNPGASNKTIIFGDFSRGYAVRQVRDLIVVRSEELLGDKLQVAFLGFLRADGVPDDAAALRAYQHSAT